jgi:hypothetical protein
MNTGKLAVAATFAAGAALVLAGCATSLDPTAQHFADSTTFPAKIGAVRLNTAGSVTIAVTDSPVTSVQRTVYYHGDKPGQTVSAAGGTLVLGSCGAECTVSYVIAVPRGAAVTGQNSAGPVELDGVASVDLRTGSGAVRVADVPGRVSVTTGSGSVEVDTVGSAQVHTSSGTIRLAGATGTVDAEAASGSVTATGLHGASTLRTTNGSIDATAATAVDLSAQTTNGSVSLTVPAGDYRLAVTTGHGHAQVDGGVHGNTGAAHALTAATGNGRISIAAAAA